MNILGIEKSSFIDYPNRISTVIFTGGCNFSCPYCHNSHLLKQQGKVIDVEEVLSFLKKRKKFVDALCITGGEPTLQKDLMDFIKRVKGEGFFIKLDTNGTNPRVLKDLFKENLLDYVAMDIKAPLIQYDAVVHEFVDVATIKESIQLIQNSGNDYEFRTTVCQELLNSDALLQLAEEIKGSRRYYLQNFRDGENIYAGVNKYTPYPKETLELVREKIEGWFEICQIR